MSHQNLRPANDENCSSSDDDFIRLEQPAVVMDVLEQEKQQQNGNDFPANPFDISTSASELGTSGVGKIAGENAQIGHNWKIEAKNEELMAQNCVLEEGNKALMPTRLKYEANEKKINVTGQMLENKLNKKFQHDLDESELEYAIRDVFNSLEQNGEEFNGNLNGEGQSESSSSISSASSAEVEMLGDNVMIESSSLLIAGRQYKIAPKRLIELNKEFITIPVHKGQETWTASLSFKHFVRIQIFDNGDIAGLVMHMNDYMANKLHKYLNFGKRPDELFPCPTDKSIVFDIQNCEPEHFSEIRQRLKSAGRFHQKYVIEQLYHDNKNVIDQTFGQPYLTVISKVKWNAMYGIWGKTPLLACGEEGENKEAKEEHWPLDKEDGPSLDSDFKGGNTGMQESVHHRAQDQWQQMMECSLLGVPMTEIHSFFLLITGRQYKISPTRKIDLNYQFITLPIVVGQETLLAYLKFKNILRIEILDNGEKAGLILYMDDFMSEKLLKFLNGSGVEANRIQDTTYYFLKSRYIMLDILNGEPENLIKIREILQHAGTFAQSSAPAQPYLSTISEAHWKSMFGISCRAAFLKKQSIEFHCPLEKHEMALIRICCTTGPFDWPNGIGKPEWRSQGDVYGCGLFVDPKNKLCIFFTGNGILLGKPIPISTSVPYLYPTVSMSGNVTFEANFGDNLAKPFQYDIDKCPGIFEHLETRHQQTVKEDNDDNGSIKGNRKFVQIDQQSISASKQIQPQPIEYCKRERELASSNESQEKENNLMSAALESLCLLYNRAHYNASVVPKILEELEKKTAQIRDQRTPMLEIITKSLKSRVEEEINDGVVIKQRYEPEEDTKPLGKIEEWAEEMLADGSSHEELLQRLIYRNQFRLKELKMDHRMVLEHETNMKYQEEFLVNDLFELDPEKGPINFDDTVVSDELLAHLEEQYHSWGEQRICKSMQSLLGSWPEILKNWKVKLVECKSAILAWQKHLDRSVINLFKSSPSMDSNASQSAESEWGEEERERNEGEHWPSDEDNNGWRSLDMNSDWKWGGKSLEETIKENQQEMQESANEIAMLKEELAKSTKKTEECAKGNSILKEQLVKGNQLIKVNKIAQFKNRWNGSNAKAKISEDGLCVSNAYEWNAVFAIYGFPITEHCRKNNFQGTIVYYFEANGEERWKRHCYNYVLVGLSSGNIPTQGKHANLSDSSLKSNPNCYAISSEEDFCYVDGKKHEFEWPEGAVKPKSHKCEDVIGCGLLLNPENKVAIFFTKNGTLMGNKIPISPSLDLDCLYPTVEIYDAWGMANFGGNPVKPFKFDIDKLNFDSEFSQYLLL